MKEEILKKVNSYLHEKGIIQPIEDVHFSTILKNDLSLDSLEILEISMELENVFGIDLSSQTAVPETIGDLCNMIEEGIKQRQEKEGFTNEEIGRAISDIEKKVKQLAYSSQDTLVILVSKKENKLTVKSLF